jgi:hypothetical protein
MLGASSVHWLAQDENAGQPWRVACVQRVRICLHHPSCALACRTLVPYEGGDAPGAAAVAFDHSGNYLAVGGVDARVYGVKQVLVQCMRWPG